MNRNSAFESATGRVLEVLTGRVFGLIAGVTVLLTAAMVGVVALLTGETTDAGGRFQYYVLVTAVAFVVTLWKLDEEGADGPTVLIATSGIALVGGLLVSLALEGLIAVVRDPGRLVGSQLLVYFVAAGLICTGLGMWGLRHWREFTVYEST